MAKKLLVLLCLFMFVVLLVGCGAPITEGNPFGLDDPNQIKAWADFIVVIGESTQGVGAATASPQLLVYGALLVLVGGTAGRLITGNRKDKNNAKS